MPAFDSGCYVLFSACLLVRVVLLPSRKRSKEKRRFLRILKTEDENEKDEKVHQRLPVRHFPCVDGCKLFGGRLRLPSSVLQQPPFVLPSQTSVVQDGIPAAFVRASALLSDA